MTIANQLFGGEELLEGKLLQLDLTFSKKKAYLMGNTSRIKSIPKPN